MSDSSATALPLVNDRIFLVRHGRTAMNVDGRLRGHLDPLLDEVGKAEVSALAMTLAARAVTRVVTGPLTRTRETAAAIGEAIHAEPLVDFRLIDRDYGQWTGRLRDDVVAEWGSLDAALGVESAASVAQRGALVLDEQLPFLAAGPIVLVAHDAVNRLLLHALDPGLGAAESIGQRTACWNELVRDGRSWQVERVDQPPSQRID